MKILVANVSTAEKNDPFIVEHLVPVWRANMKKVALPDTELVFRFPEWGVVGLEGNFYHGMQMLTDSVIYHMCKNAEEEGFDAVLVTCFADAFLEPLRQFLEVPVASIGESSCHLAAKMGKRFGIVTISPHNVYETERMMEEYGLAGLCAGIIPTEELPQEQPLALVNARHCIEAFEKSAKALICRGAEVIIPGCGLMTPGLRMAPGCEEQYPEGVTEVEGAAVLDVMAAGILDAENLVRLKRAGSAWIARNGWYAKPSDSVIETNLHCFTDGRVKFWDVE